VQSGSLGIALRRCTVKEVEVKGPVLNALTQHINHTTFADFTGETGKKLETIDIPRVIRISHGKLSEWFRLRSTKE